MPELSKIAAGLEHSPTLWLNEQVGAIRAGGSKVYHMGFGQSPFPVAERLKEALAKEAYRKDYVPSAGLKELCETVQQYFVKTHGASYMEQVDVIVAPGSKLILYGLQMAIEGDLIMPVPSWVSYAPQARMLHSDVIALGAKLDDDGYHIDAAELSEVIRAARAKGQNPRKLVLNSPNNPTGLCIPDDELQQIAKVCKEEDVLIISDEIYGQVRFDQKYSTIAKYAPEHTAVSTGLSKHLSLGGWRLGVGLIPKAQAGLADALSRISSETWSCVATPIQRAAIEAYRGHEDIEKHIADCTAIHGLMNRTISQGLKDAGIICPMAQGAFYNYPNFAPFREELERINIRSSVELHRHLLSNYNLAALPGTGFGEEDTQLTLRLSGCDYDGEAALSAYQSGTDLDSKFVESYAPNVLQAIKQFSLFIDTIRSAAA